MKQKKYKLSKDINNVHIKKMLLPDNLSNRLHIKQIPKYIVIHETELGLRKYPAEYDMNYYKELITKEGQEGKTIGYHYLCGDKEIWQFIPDDERAHHVGSSINNCSIGLERLINEGTSFPDALHNQAKLAATLMYKWNIPIENVISHKTGRLLGGALPKECPNRLIAGQYGGFKLFYQEVKKCLEVQDFFYEILDTDQKTILKH